MSGGFVSSFVLTPANTNGQGITTDGSRIWVVDSLGNRATYRYSLNGVFESSFLLTDPNTNPSGMTTTP